MKGMKSMKMDELHGLICLISFTKRVHA